MKTYQKILLSIMFTFLIFGFFAIFFYFPILFIGMPILLAIVFTYQIYKFIDNELK